MLADKEKKSKHLAVGTCAHPDNGKLYFSILSVIQLTICPSLLV